MCKTLEKAFHEKIAKMPALVRHAVESCCMIYDCKTAVNFDLLTLRDTLSMCVCNEIYAA